MGIVSAFAEVVTAVDFGMWTEMWQAFSRNERGKFPGRENVLRSARARLAILGLALANV